MQDPPENLFRARHVRPTLRSVPALHPVAPWDVPPMTPLLVHVDSTRLILGKDKRFTPDTDRIDRILHVGLPSRYKLKWVVDFVHDIAHNPLVHGDFYLLPSKSIPRAHIKWQATPQFHNFVEGDRCAHR